MSVLGTTKHSPPTIIVFTLANTVVLYCTFCTFYTYCTFCLDHGPCLCFGHSTQSKELSKHQLHLPVFPARSSIVSGFLLSGYWAILAWLLTPLTFARHRLSPLAAVTSVAYFPHNGRR